MKARIFRTAAFLITGLACAAACAQVASFPVKPVRLVIPFPPGGSIDALARAMGNELGRLWGQPVVVDGRPGGGGVLAAAGVARSAADGYTIFLADEGPLTMVPVMQRDLPYDAARDFAMVIALVQASRLVVVPSSSQVNTIADLIAAAKARPGTINFGSWGVGSVAHLAAEEFASAAGVAFTHVPYKGAAELTRGLLGGEVQLAFHSLGAVLPQVKQGQLRALGYAGQKRSLLLPDVPTVAESGLPGFNTGSWLGFVVAAATPRPIIDRIAADSGRVLALQPFVDKYITGAGFEVFGLPPDPFAQLFAQTRVKNEALLKRLNLQAR